MCLFICRLVNTSFFFSFFFFQAEDGIRDIGVTGVQTCALPIFQLGRRFRALKLWMILRHFGAEGLRASLAEHMRLAQTFAGWVDASDRFVRIAPVPFSVVCFRLRDSGGAADDEEHGRVLD